MPANSDISFEWNTSSSAARYRLKVCTNSAMNSCISGSPFEPPLGQTWYTVSGSTFSPGATYYWQVGAIAANDVGGWGVYGPSPAWSFTVKTASPPDPPTLNSPANGSTPPAESDVTFSWNSSSGAARYRLKVCTNSAMNSCVSGSPFEPPLGQTWHTLPGSTFAPGATYYWQVGAIATNDVGGWGVYGPSPAWSFTVHLPDPPTLSSPVNGGTTPAASDVTFSWNSSPGAARYRLKVCPNSAMNSCVSGSPFEPPLGQTWYTVSGSTFSPGATYYWQVGAIAANDVGGWGVYGPSPAWSFTVKTAIPPDPPTLSSPVNGSTTPAASDVTFSWNSSPGAARYRLKVCPNSAMNSCVSGSPFEPPLGQTWYTVSGSTFSSGATYYWQVGAIAANDVGGWGVYGPSPAWSFTVKTASPPDPPTLSSPANGSTTPAESDVTFRWNSSPGAARYRLKVCPNSAMNSCVSGSPFEPPLSQTWYTVSGSTFSPGATYYWQVGAIAANDVGGWGVYGPSPAWSFTIDNSKPDIPTIPTEVSVNNITDGFRVTWNSVSGVGGSTPYQVYWRTTSPVDENNYADIFISSSNQVDHPNLINGTTYYYRVQACNSSGCSALSNTVSKKYVIDLSRPALSSSKTVMEVGQRVDLICQLGTGSAGHQVAFFVNSQDSNLGAFEKRGHHAASSQSDS